MMTLTEFLALVLTAITCIGAMPFVAHFWFWVLTR